MGTVLWVSSLWVSSLLFSFLVLWVTYGLSVGNGETWLNGTRVS